MTIDEAMQAYCDHMNQNYEAWAPIIRIVSGCRNTTQALTTICEFMSLPSFVLEAIGVFDNPKFALLYKELVRLDTDEEMKTLFCGIHTERLKE